jgi:hypothetical protein
MIPLNLLVNNAHAHVDFPPMLMKNECKIIISIIILLVYAYEPLPKFLNEEKGLIY